MASSLLNPPALRWRRAALALAASLLVHALLLELSGGGGPAARVTAQALHAELTTALPPVQTVTEHIPAQPAPVVLPKPPVAMTGGPAAQAAPEAGGAEQSTAGADNRIYSARELDRFPQPLQPLPRWQGTSLRLWLTIDARGQVVDIAAAAGEPSPEPLWRERFAGVVFSPALRAERAVKARILLELGE